MLRPNTSNCHSIRLVWKLRVVLLDLCPGELCELTRVPGAVRHREDEQDHGECGLRHDLR